MNDDFGAEYDAHRFDDERGDERDYERVTHARADEGADFFPCGTGVRELVAVGDVDEVTCPDCLHAMFPSPDERERYIRYGTGLGYRHGPRLNRVTPCGIYVWPDDDSRSCPREAMHGETVDCPRCCAAMGGGR